VTAVSLKGVSKQFNAGVTALDGIEELLRIYVSTAVVFAGPTGRL
jgi:hypothetical protein